MQITAFCCNWCSYAGADLAGSGRMGYPAEVRLIRVPCSCRVNPLFVLRALENGSDGVILCGCHPGDCHYTSGNFFTRRRMSLLISLLEYLGIEKERVRVEWISASEGAKFARVMNEFAEDIAALPENKHLRDLRSRENGAWALPENAPTTPDMCAASSLEKTAALVRRRVTELMESGEDMQTLAWEETDGTVMPALLEDADETTRLYYGTQAGANLSKLAADVGLPEKKTVLLLKPCDSRAFAQSVREHRLDRERFYTIGVGCRGMEKNGKLLARCVGCDKRDFVECDEILDAEDSPMPAGDRFAGVKALESMTGEERFAFWRHELSRCIRCNACRNACPACGCIECVFDSPASGVGAKANETAFEESIYHVLRALHTAGRCSDCGECSRVCPQGIPLHLLTRKLIKDSDTFWGHFEAGVSEEAREPLTSYTRDDPEPWRGEADK